MTIEFTDDAISSEIASIANAFLTNECYDGTDNTRIIARRICQRYGYTTVGAVDRIQADIDDAIYCAYHNRD